MEFEEMKKIWDTQNDRPLFVIDEPALHRRIISKKNQSGRISHISELLLILVNIGAGGLVLGVNLSSRNMSAWMNVMSAWMFVTALYVIVKRVGRLIDE